MSVNRLPPDDETIVIIDKMKSNGTPFRLMWTLDETQINSDIRLLSIKDRAYINYLCIGARIEHRSKMVRDDVAGKNKC